MVLGLVVIAASGLAFQVYWTRYALWRIYDPNEECVKLGGGHLEWKFVREGACFSRRRVQEILINMVLNTTAIFTAHGITNWLDSGTFLGAYRHQSIIPYDQDADLGIDYEGYLILRDNPIEFLPELHLQVWNSSIHPEETRFEGLPVRVVHKESALYVDVFVYKDSKDHYWNGSPMIGPVPSGCYIGCRLCPKIISENGDEGWELLLPRFYIYPLQDCAFAGHTRKCPNKLHDYFVHMFGEDYMVPEIYPY
ncbi:TPA: hypothetical protein N0F65_008827 [Lagenidium giganteum]|uniref:LicD/FKTN/FKRP nucleotidyltransferase domain-containing protein n=1 Tax=Lagenidium giganteum TaxID=4803 RepID=A0AAV2YT23_9STRA|nr:TPA: hypothetical protein N0F65_008827 [Lagenidium giganteum]